MVRGRQAIRALELCPLGPCVLLFHGLIPEPAETSSRLKFRLEYCLFSRTSGTTHWPTQPCGAMVIWPLSCPQFWDPSIAHQIGCRAGELQAAHHGTKEHRETIRILSPFQKWTLRHCRMLFWGNLEFKPPIQFQTGEGQPYERTVSLLFASNQTWLLDLDRLSGG